MSSDSRHEETPDRGESDEVLTPLHLAALEGRLVDVQCAVSNGSDVNVKTNKGMTPLHSAVIAEQPQVLDFFLKNGGNPDLPNNLGGTPLLYAALKDKSELAKQLIDAGACVDFRDIHGMTPLHYAALGLHLKTAEVLITGGANINEKDDVNCSPLGVALEKKDGGAAFCRKILYHAVRLGRCDSAAKALADIDLVWALRAEDRQYARALWVQIQAMSLHRAADAYRPFIKSAEPPKVP